MMMRQRSIPHESLKKKISNFHLEKGMFPFIVTANYHICSILLCLNLIDVEFSLSCLQKERQSVNFDRHFFFKLRNNLFIFSNDYNKKKYNSILRA